jgi:glycosyltransferase involved in cell wall biosynthesis
VHRRPIAGLNFSVERYFAAVRGAMPGDIAVRVKIVPEFSTGVWRRVVDMVSVALIWRGLVHVTGDIHFVNLLVPRRRSVLTVHDCRLAEEGNAVVRFIYRWLWLRLPVRRAGRVVAVSEFTRNQLAEFAGVTADRIEVIPTTIDDDFVPAPARVADGAPRVLFIGSTPNKNLDRCVEALRGLDVELHVVGSVGDDPRSALAEAGVRWTSEEGVSDDRLRQAYAEADVILFPSTYEGFGMPIVEAQATARPVVTSDRAPMNEVAGGAACLVDPEDAASIRAGLERVLTDAAYRDELVKKGLVNRERFRPAVAAEAYARVYRDLESA